MKTLTLLSVLQTAAIVFLLVKVLALEPAHPPRATDTGALAAPSMMVPDEEQLRKIIREELAAQLVSDAPAPSGSPAVEPVVATREQRAQKELVEKQLDYYRMQGAISPVEMQNLQGEIAKLEPVTRKQMLARLVKAMNAGEIRGAL